MYARALALDGPFPDLAQASNPSLDWPVGNLPYLLGGRFVAFLEARHGPEALAGFSSRRHAVPPMRACAPWRFATPRASHRPW